MRRFEPRHYFAFGSNMNPQRVRARGLRFTSIAGARLVGYRLAFDKVAREHPGSGHASIAWAPEDVVEGVLYELADADEILKMDHFEHTPINYSREVVRVEHDGAPLAAWTYIANPAVQRHGGRPERAYLEHLLAGREWLTPEYHARLAGWPLAAADGDDD